MFFLSPYYFQTPVTRAKEEMALGKQNLRAACPKDKLKFKLFLRTGIYVSQQC